MRDYLIATTPLNHHPCKKSDRSYHIFFYGRAQVHSKFLTNHPCMRDTCKFTLSLGLLSPPNPSFSGIRKGRTFYEISVWNAESQHLMHKCSFERNYSSCTSRSSENLCNSHGNALAKRKTGWNSGTINSWMLVYFFAGFFLNLTLSMTKLRVLVCCLFLTLGISLFVVHKKCSLLLNGRILLSLDPQAYTFQHNKGTHIFPLTFIKQLTTKLFQLQ